MVSNAQASISCFSNERTPNHLGFLPQQFSELTTGFSPQTLCPIWETQFCPNHSVPQVREPTFNGVFSPLRDQKMLLPEKQTPEVLYLAEAGTKDENNLNILRETLLSEKPNLAQVEIELKERDVALVLLPDPQESES